MTTRSKRTALGAGVASLLVGVLTVGVPAATPAGAFSPTAGARC